MSYVHPVNENLTAVFLFRHPTSGAALTGIAASINAIIYDEEFASHFTGHPTEIANGLYYYVFLPDADGTWIPFAEYTGVTPHQAAAQAFIIGADLGALISAIKTKTDTITWTNITDILADTAELQGDWANGGRLDLLVDAIKAKTDLIGASVAPAGEYDTEAAHLDADISSRAPASEYDTEMAHLDQDLSTTESNIRGTDSDTLKTLSDQIDDVPTTSEAEGYVENAVDGGDLTHDITTANDTVETQVTEIAKTGIYTLSVYFDLDTLESAVEGGLIKIRVYNKVDGTNYSNKPVAYIPYVVGAENEYPSVEANMLHGYTKLTIQCTTDVTATRTVAYRVVTRDLGA